MQGPSSQCVVYAQCTARPTAWIYGLGLHICMDEQWIYFVSCRSKEGAEREGCLLSWKAAVDYLATRLC